MKWEEEDMTEAGVVKDKAWNAIVAGACGIGALVMVLVLAVI